jgi:hypothetical protein
VYSVTNIHIQVYNNMIKKNKRTRLFWHRGASKKNSINNNIRVQFYFIISFDFEAMSNILLKSQSLSVSVSVSVYKKPCQEGKKGIA